MNILTVVAVTIFTILLTLKLSSAFVCSWWLVLLAPLIPFVAVIGLSLLIIFAVFFAALVFK